MEERGLKDLPTLSSLISIYCSLKDIQKSIELIDKVQVTDAILYNPILNYFLTEKDVDNFQKVEIFMREKGVSYDLGTYKILLSHYSSNGNAKRCEELFKEIETQWRTPWVAYSQIIQVFIDKGDVLKMEEYYDKAKQNGVTPIHYNLFKSILSFYTTMLDVRKCLATIDEMRNLGPWDISIYNTVLDSLTYLVTRYRLKIDVLVQFIIEIFEKKLAFNWKTYHQLLMCYARLGDIERFEAVLGQYRSEANIKLPLSIYNYELLLYTYRMDTKLVNQTLDRMSKDKVLLDGLGVSALLRMFSRQNNEEMIDILLKYSKSSNIELHHTGTSAVLKYYIRVKSEDQIKQKILEFSSSNLTPLSPQIHILIIQMCIKSGNIGDAEEYFQSMTQRGIALNTMHYNILVAGYLRNNLLGPAMKLMERMKSLSIPMDDLIYQTLCNYHAMGNFKYYQYFAKEILKTHSQCYDNFKELFILYTFQGKHKHAWESFLEFRRLVPHSEMEYTFCIILMALKKRLTPEHIKALLEDLQEANISSAKFSESLRLYYFGMHWEPPSTSEDDAVKETLTALVNK
uniref:Pentacotripeptide-repeat region of PRORP domain-containing protein n=1 Tax=Arcella intermedia TaxID=1963864 RepID=A0A6B2L0A0_9EUKA